MHSSSSVFLFVVNAPEFFLSHRLPLAIAVQEAGFEVHVGTPDGPSVQRIKSHGFIHHIIHLERKSQNLFKELLAFVSLIRLFRKTNPLLVHLVSIKPVLYGGIAARLTGVSSVVSAVSGLGSVFQGDSLFARFRCWFVTLLYRIAFRKQGLLVIFQNPDDREKLLSTKALEARQARIIRGSGVFIDAYTYKPEPPEGNIVVMASRLLGDKGVFEYVEAARLLKKRGIKVEMRLIGAIDSANPTSVDQEQLEQWEAEGCVELVGFSSNIASEYADANIVCLPSYREGLPKSLIEAAACGRAVITTDVPGCRDAITKDITGLLVPVKKSAGISECNRTFVK